AADFEIRAVVALHDGLADASVLTRKRRDLTQHEIDFALADELHHLVDAFGRGAELAAPVHESEVTRNRREGHRPIEGGIAAARDDDALAAQRLDLPHGVENGGALIGLDSRDRRPLGLE